MTQTVVPGVRTARDVRLTSAACGRASARPPHRPPHHQLAPTRPRARPPHRPPHHQLAPPRPRAHRLLRSAYAAKTSPRPHMLRFHALLVSGDLLLSGIQRGALAPPRVALVHPKGLLIGRVLYMKSSDQIEKM